MKFLKIFLALIFIISIASKCNSQGATTASTTTTNEFSEISEIINSDRTDYTLIDVRTFEEFSSGHIENAINIPYDALLNNFKEKDKNKLIIIYCRSGRRTSIAKETLKGMGYTNVLDFGGINNWKGPLVKD